MDLDKVIGAFESEISSLTNSELIREKLIKLEEEYGALQKDSSHGDKSAQQAQGEPIKLWLRLVEIGIKHSNLELSLLLVGRLKKTPLRRALQLILTGEQPAEFNARLALLYIANYFAISPEDDSTQWIDQLSWKATPTSLPPERSLHELEAILQYWLDSDDWTRVFDFISTWPDRRQAQSITRLMFFERAHQFEYEEKFSDSLRSHERAGTVANHGLRLALKRLPGSLSREVFEIDCQGAPLDFLAIFAHQLKSQIKVKLTRNDLGEENTGQGDGDDLGSYFRVLLRSDPTLARELTFASLNEKLSTAIEGFDIAKLRHANHEWDQTRVLSALLTARQRDELAALVKHNLEFSSSVDGLTQSILFHLGYPRALFGIMLQNLFVKSNDHDDAFKHLDLFQCYSRMSRCGQAGDASLDMIRMIESKSGNNKRRNSHPVSSRQSHNNHPTTRLNVNEKIKLAELLLNQGLLDECLRVSLWALSGLAAGDQATTSSWFTEACHLLLEKIDDQSRKIEHNPRSGRFYRAKLRDISVILRRDTIELAIEQIATRSMDRDLSANLLSFVIILLIMALHKHPSSRVNENANTTHQTVTTDIQADDEMWLEEFERLAGNLALLLRRFGNDPSETQSSAIQLTASELLIKASLNMLKVAKVKIDYIEPSDIARDCLRDLVQLVAGCCMIEGRYKQAAALHNQVGDYRSALKALMRIGDVDAVIEYALLIQDFTVFRITSNYLRHIRAPPEIIEDFESRIRENQAINNMM